MSDDPADRYLQLALRLARHDDGVIDAYFGSPDLAREVEEAHPVAPADLVNDAERLLDDLGDGWLRDQVVGLRTVAGRLSGERVPYRDEVEACYGVRPGYTDRAVLDAAYDELRPPAARERTGVGAVPSLGGVPVRPRHDDRAADGRRGRGGPQPDP